MGYDFSRLSALVVDDSIHMRRLVCTILEGFGCTCIQDAPDAEEGFAILREIPVDVLILDWAMEPMDGIEMTRRIRAGKEGIPNPYLPIIMLTGHTERRRIMEARDAGVTEFLAKPVSPKGLMQRLKVIVEKPRPYVRTPSFFGPDRRRLDSSFYRGPERREDEMKDKFELDDPRPVKAAR